jgi:hypothetical protein
MSAPTPTVEVVSEKSGNQAAPASAAAPVAAPVANALASSSTSSISAASSAPGTPTQTKATASEKSEKSEKNGSTGNVTAAVPEEEAISYVNQEGDWKYRKINLFKVMRGFVSQLKPGQDLTKISLPAECCTPYGLLEVMGSRELAMFHLTFDFNRHPDEPLERFFAALRFFFGTVRSERFDKKPWNPVLGETHITYADVIYGEDGIGTTETVQLPPTSPKGTPAPSNAPAASSSSASSSSAPSAATGPRSRTVFVGEQVSHHPPISAISLSNEREQVQCNANVSFTVKFGGNQVTVATAGGLQLVSKRFNETYELTKCLPDMVVRNVVWGKKYIMWEGEVTMSCPQTGYTAFIKFKEKSSQNVVKGFIMKGDSDEPLIEINGVAGERIMYHYVNGKDSTEPKVLLDLTREPSARIHYLPKSKLAPLSSVGVWEKVNKAIVDDNISLADKEKKVIEQAQRERAKARVEMNQEYQGYYFDMSPDGIWTYKNNMDLQTVLKEGAHSIDPTPTVPSDDSEDEFVSQDEPEPLLSSGAPVNGSESILSDPDRSPITSGDEADMEDLDTINIASSQLEVPTKRRRGSSTGLKTKGSSSSLAISSSMAPSSSKKELRAEKKKAREEVKLMVTKMKEEKKKGTISATLLEGQVYAGMCKVRNLMKQWKDRYLVVLPGRLVIFRSASDAAKSSASGMLLLQGCDVRPRPSKKDGSCFKIYSLNQYPIYSKQGLKGESISSALLPVGADYCILRSPDASSMNQWIEKIRQCIPDWEKNRNLIKAAGLEGVMDDSDSDDDSEDSDMEPSNNAFPIASSSMLPSVSATSLNASVSGDVGTNGAVAPSPASSISNEEILNQIGQLYKITRKFTQRQRKYMDSMDEFRTKGFPEQMGDVKRLVGGSSSSLIASSSSSSIPGSSSTAAPTTSARKNPFEKMKEAKAESRANSITSRLRAQLDLKTCILLAIIAYLVLHILLF